MHGINLVDILIGLGIAILLRRRWYLIPLGGIAASMLFNGVFDWLSYNNFFTHPRELEIDAIGFTIWGYIMYFVVWFIRKVRRLDTPKGS